MKATESALSNALCESLALMHSAAVAQNDVTGTTVKTHSTMKGMAKIIEGLLGAQEDALRTHGRLNSIAREVNGPEEPTCPDEQFFTTGEHSEAG